MIKDITQILKAKCKVMQGDRIVAGVSGGADSVCLLLCLLEASKKMNLKLSALHVHHQIRGEEADRDSEFTRILCQNLGIDFKLVKIDVPKISKELGLSIEEAGRKARYEALLAEAGDGFVAVAHNRDDQQETILLNIIRGSGLAGAGGMDYINGKIIRPLLGTSRKEIEEYLKEKNQAYCIDSTNLSTDYTRNKVRHELMPLLKNINEKAGEHLEALAADCKGAKDLIEARAMGLLGQCQRIKDGVIIEDATVFGEADIIVSGLVHKALCFVAGRSRDITRAHIYETAKLFSGRTGASVSLPYAMVARREYDRVVITRVTDKKAEEDEKFSRLNEDLKTSEIIYYKKDTIIPEKPYTKWFDYDKIETPLCWRGREAGDSIQLFGVGKKAITRFMIDCKIPKDQRDAYPILTAGKEVLWVPGYRISEKYKVTSETKRIIIISYKENRNE